MPTITTKPAAIFVQNSNDLAAFISATEKEKSAIAYVAGSISSNSIASIYFQTMRKDEIIADMIRCIDAVGIESAVSRIKNFTTDEYRNVVVNINASAAEFIKFKRSEKYDDNVERYGNNSRTCECCGKQTDEKLFVHICTSYEITTSKNDDLTAYGRESQGYFPIGRECAKKFPQQYIHTI